MTEGVYGNMKRASAILMIIAAAAQLAVGILALVGSGPERDR